MSGQANEDYDKEFDDRLESLKKEFEQATGEKYRYESPAKGRNLVPIPDLTQFQTPRSGLKLADGYTDGRAEPPHPVFDPQTPPAGPIPAGATGPGGLSESDARVQALLPPELRARLRPPMAPGSGQQEKENYPQGQAPVDYSRERVRQMQERDVPRGAQEAWGVPANYGTPDFDRSAYGHQAHDLPSNRTTRVTVSLSRSTSPGAGGPGS